MADEERLFPPGSPEYEAATAPANSSGVQRPRFVARPVDPRSVGELVRDATARGLLVRPQCTGHGAGGDIGDDTILVDTSGLDTVDIDVPGRRATVGAGCTWGQVNGRAYPHGLLGLAGTTPAVGVCGYTFGGGVGWLARPHGLASSSLRRVEFVDGLGRLRTASEDAADPADRDALWAFRGGGGVGIATELEIDLVPVPDLHAGYLLWKAEHLPAVAAAWSAALSVIGETTATSLAVVHAPPGAPVFPEQLRGTPVVHLAVASSDGEASAAPMLEAVRSAAPVELDTWGGADLTTLGGIHLDPPAAVPAVGAARWLDGTAPALAGTLLGVGAPTGSALAMVEIRNVDSSGPARDGACTRVPGSFVVHGVGDVSDPQSRAATVRALGDLARIARPADVGLGLGSWMEGATSVPDALPPAVRQRAATIADAVDPHHTIGRSRYVA